MAVILAFDSIQPMVSAIDPSVLVAIPIGVLIGATGVGGVLLVPALIYIAGMTVPQAIGIAMLGYCGPGAVALLSARRSTTLSNHAVAPLLLATVPGALIGVVALAWLPARGVLVLLGIAITLCGAYQLFRLAPPPDSPRRDHAGAATGLLAGFGSALTASSGPLVLVPWLLARGTPVLEAIMVGQLVQLPIASAATIGNMLASEVNLAAGLAVALLLVPGVVAGQRFAHAIPVLRLRRLVGITLIVAGALLLLKAGF